MVQCAVRPDVPSPHEAFSNPPAVAAYELNELLVTLQAAGNVARRRFIDALRTMAESGLHTRLGFSTIAAYAETTFGFGRSQVFEYLRVSRALPELPAIARAFETGEISFSRVAELTRAATGETEEEWLELVRARPRVASAEIKDAARKKRTRPRKDGRESLGELVRLPDACLVEPIPRSGESGESGMPDSRLRHEVESEAALALRGLGDPSCEAERRVARAWERLAARETALETLTVERVLGEALRSSS